MGRGVGLRVMMYDKSNGRYLKAIDGKDWCDFWASMIEPRAGVLPLSTLQLLIDVAHGRLMAQWQDERSKELRAKQNALFNKWVRLKSFTIPAVAQALALEVMRESESLRGLLHFDITDQNKTYRSLDDELGYVFPYDPKSCALLELLKKIDAFLETVLCDLHATATLDSASLQNDVILFGHTKSMQELLVSCLQHELRYFPSGFSHSSIIYHYCFEDVGVNPSALLQYAEIDESVEGLIRDAESRGSLVSSYADDGKTPIKIRTTTWVAAHPSKLGRVRKLLRSLDKVNAILGLLMDCRERSITIAGRLESEDAVRKEIEIFLSEA
ncbi:hypothetical protein DIE11_28340 [Burkholderia sp. Bp9012]|nr:hypothetical protein DIE11_28340 [Burkholderia sp. Bp9012]